MVVRLCVPDTQRFVARNWNRASSGCGPTAPMVASSVGVSTPLRGMGGAFGGIVGVVVVRVISTAVMVESP